MKRKTLPLFLILVLLSGNASLVFAQQTDSTSDWNAVKRLPTNTKLIIKQKNGKEVSGSMIEATDTALTIEHDRKPLSIARADLRQVFRIEGKAAKGKWAAICGGIGAGSGAAIGYTQYKANYDDYEIYPVMGLLIGAGAGAVTGLFVGQTRRKRELVYGTY